MKFYKFSCLIMGILSAVVFLTTLVFAFSGDNFFNNSQLYTGILLLVFGVLTAICLCISVIGGNVTYKLGFYILHGGLLLLIIGFIIYGVLGQKYNVSVFKGETFYNSINDTTVEGGKLVDLGFSFRFDGIETEYHLDENGNPTSAPKMYTAYLTVLQNGSSEVQNIVLSVNDPVRINGYKIYLMSISNDGQNGATFLFKRDPSEFTITAGMVMTIAGSFIMCYLSELERKKAKIGGDAK